MEIILLENIINLVILEIKLLSKMDMVGTFVEKRQSLRFNKTNQDFVNKK